MKLNKYMQKICCFYASDWHLTVMLLPYINNKIKENVSIYMRCENNIEDKMKILLNKLEIKNKENIMSIDWNEQVAEDDLIEDEKIYIVSGSNKFICDTNEMIEQYYKSKNTNVKIINCYEINNNSDLKSIIQQNGYKKILNTKGENNINEEHVL